MIHLTPLELAALTFGAPLALVALCHLLVHLLLLAKLPKAAASVAKYTATVNALLPVAIGQLVHPGIISLATDLSAASKASPDDVFLVRTSAMARRLAGGLAVSVLLLIGCGCTDIVGASVRVVNASHDAIAISHDGIEAAERDELAAAVKAAPDEYTAKKATAGIEARYQLAWDRYADVRLSWLAARATVAGAEAWNASNGGSVNKLGLLSALAVLANAWEQLGSTIAANVKGGK